MLQTPPEVIDYIRQLDATKLFARETDYLTKEVKQKYAVCPKDEVPHLFPDISLCSFVRIELIAYRDRREIQKSLARFYGVMRQIGKAFWYIIRTKQGVTSLYMGLVSNDRSLNSNDLANSLLGMLPGCRITTLTTQEIRELLPTTQLRSNTYSCMLTGIPTIPERSAQTPNRPAEEKNQVGIEQLIDSLAGSDFTLSIISSPLKDAELEEFRQIVARAYNTLNPHIKLQFNASMSEATGTGTSNTVTDTKGHTKTEGTTQSQSTSVTHKDGNIAKRALQTLISTIGGGDIPVQQLSSQEGTNTSESTNTSKATAIGTTTSKTHTQSRGLNVEQVNVSLKNTCEQLEKLYKRIVEAQTDGMWRTGVLMQSESRTTLKRATFAAKTMWNGADSVIDPINHISLPPINPGSIGRSLSLLMQKTKHPNTQHLLGEQYNYLYTCLTNEELAYMANLPYWDLPGIHVQPIVEYGRISPPVSDSTGYLSIGQILDRTSVPGEKSTPITLGYDQLNKHCFVGGVTGSGKSTTMRTLLTRLAGGEKPVPFMVIEPVKTEYARMCKNLPGGAKVYSLGRPGCAYSLNPFSFNEETGLVAHLDFLKAAFNALLGSYSSMPFILERLICRAYKNKGWDLVSGMNESLEIALRSELDQSMHNIIRESYMPLIQDLLPDIPEVLKEFFGEDKSDYSISLKGAMHARLSSLTSSAKGTLLNSHETVDFAELLKENVIFELQGFADNDEKAFIMALLLGRVYEYRQAEALRGIHNNGLQHIVVIEEAHRLLSQPPTGGDTHANPRGKAVEIFSDMLAEVRAYGQGMVIVDQSPGKLTPEVLKNTEVKIAHRMLYREDREAIGATMNLQKEQVEDLARHEPGEATVYFGNLRNALHVKISPQ